MWNNESIPRKRRAAHQEDKLYTDHCEKVMYLDMCFGLWLLSLCTQGYVNFTENAVFRYNDIQRQMVCQIRRQAWEYFSNNKIFNNAMSMSTLQRENNFLIWISDLEILNKSYWYFPGLLSFLPNRYKPISYLDLFFLRYLLVHLWLVLNILGPVSIIQSWQSLFVIDWCRRNSCYDWSLCTAT